jgi:hypothetical protein
MIIGLLMGAWLGFIAYRKGQKWYIWGPIGLAISFVLSMAVTLPFDMLIGDREYDPDPDIYVALILGILNVAAGLFISSKIRDAHANGAAAARSRPPRDYTGIRGDSPSSGGEETTVASTRPTEPWDGAIPDSDLASSPGGALIAEERDETAAHRHSSKKRVLRRVLKFRNVAARREEEVLRRMRDETLEGLRPLGRKARRILSRL